MQYLKKFQTNDDYQAFKEGDDWVTPNLSAIENDNTIFYEPILILITFTVNDVEYQAEEGMSWTKWCDSEYNVDEFWCNENNIRINYGSMIQGQTPSDVICDGCTYTLVNYLTILALEDGLTASLSNNACQYCVDGDNNWIDLPAGTATQAINQGQTLSFKGNLTPNSSGGIGTFTINKQCNLEGNCMSMLFGDDAANNNSLDGKSFAFRYLFKNCTTIIEVSESFLPATTLAIYCYNEMFYNCSKLATAPELPATTLASYCYQSMFEGCTDLTTAPSILPATTLAQSCYASMFASCSNLITAPELPATILSYRSCSYMFSNCTSLTTAPELPATMLDFYCYEAMFSGCTSLTTAPELPVTTLYDNCYAGMFSGCSKLTIAPELPATTLTSRCYYQMFSGCTSLTTAPELPATTLYNSCYYQMFNGCSNLNYIKMLATDISASSCLYDWVSGVSSKGTFVKHPDMTSLSTGISGIPSGWSVVDDTGPINTDNYLTILALENGLTASLSVNACQYCINGNGNWMDLPAGTATQTINQGQTLSFKGNLTPNSSNGIGTFTINKQCNLEGNCMSMLFGDDAMNNNSLDGKSRAFCNLFWNCTTIIEVSDTFLPATTLSDYCYSSMFFYCRNLTTAPELPATTLADDCYQRMFDGCSSLTTAPELPATTLADDCYLYMFSGCTSLTTAPALPATILSGNCYSSMFEDCTSLTTAPELPATTLAQTCYSGMFDGCSSLTTAPELPATTLSDYCYQRMFDGCSSLTTAPELPATTLVQGCYRQMFRDCSNLNYIKMLATDISATNCLSGWVSGVSSTGTFVKNVNMTSLPTGTSGIPSGWTVVDLTNTDDYLTILALEDGLTASLSMNACQYCVDGDGNWIDLPADTATQAINQGQTLSFKGNLTPDEDAGIGTFTINKQCNLEGNCMSMLFGDDAMNNNSLSGKDYAFYGLFKYCTTIIEVSDTFLPATTLSDYCYSGMFFGCTGLTMASELPATTLSTNCYLAMFYGCSNLTTAPELPATTLADYCYQYMFYGCSNLNYIKMLATDISAMLCLSGWVDTVSSTGTFVKNVNMTSLPTGTSGIPSGWTVVDAITFTVGVTQYLAEEGMTWESFVSSEYNTGYITITAPYVLFAQQAIALNGSMVEPTDIIINNTRYELIV